MIPKDLGSAVYLDEENHITKKITWMISCKLENNTFEGMDKVTIMVLDDTNQVCNVLDHNGIPIVDDREQPYDDDEFYQLFDEDEIL